MMHDLLTTSELQEILHVDRTTIYRMAEGHRIPALKVGNQWRFPRRQIENWLHQGSPASTKPLNGANGSPGDDPFPVACVQLIQDSFADVLGVMALVTDLEGNPLTKPSNPCGLYTATGASPAAQKLCTSLWIELAREPSISPAYQQGHLGLLCTRGLIRVGAEIKAMLIMGGIAPDAWPPDDEQLANLAQTLQLDVEFLKAHIHEAHWLDRERQAAVLSVVQRIADIFSHIMGERHQLFARLQQIAQISQL
jgi:excisionase family DNA binding protein